MHLIVHPRQHLELKLKPRFVTLASFCMFCMANIEINCKILTETTQIFRPQELGRVEFQKMDLLISFVTFRIR